jgi:hypothetical protein
MRRTIGLVALWFAAGAAAATVAWLGVSTVSDQLAGSGSHPDPLSAEEISAELAAEATSTSTTGTTLAGGAETTSTTSTLPAGASTTTTVAAPPPPPPSEAPSAAPVTRSYDLVGGRTTLRFSPTGVTVVVATPAAGFTAEIESSHDGGVRVEFESESHRSRVDAWWAGGPQDEVREEGEDD